MNEDNFRMRTVLSPEKIHDLRRTIEICTGNIALIERRMDMPEWIPFTDSLYNERNDNYKKRAECLQQLQDAGCE